MSGVALSTRTGQRVRPVPAYAETRDMVLAELCAALFASLPRSDQRRRGEAYVRGLLGARGRKSIRNIAALTGGQAAEQSLHHFISSSTWEWAPVRRALAHHLTRVSPPQAWVVRPMVIPKAGDNSVGVDRRFCPAVGQVLNAQQAVGVWAASAERATPVNWRLHLSDAWLADGPRRNQASIPDSVRPETLGECTVEAYLGMMRDWGLPLRPLVLDAREADAPAALQRLRACGVPVLARVSSSLRLVVADPAVPGRSPEALPAHQIMGAARDMRRPVMWRDHGPARTVRTALTAAVRVGLPVHRAAPGQPVRRRDLLLLGVGENGRQWPAELWVTDMPNVPPAALVRLGKLIDRVDRDFTEIADEVGIRDFAGRSFSGWHRHVTLASAAHAVAALTGRFESGLRLEHVS
ncbi:IS701 family transposase [Streptomyces albireticuli]|uniref:IS701 family transposase n=1 Tax=Streptomyces albireticuli TaxID=1940 RepID=UPI001E5C28BD|nr:transposase [Streptomyces albireticuli]MCD9145513.1 transposase [Streptomyces albireticuli]MCD9165198.1 transposase [Streptomyces albireticuli]MCD9195727.1 transposase [Streptomyces albireticuli]